MAKEIIYLTAEGYKKLKDELDHMRSVERPAISAAIAEARDKGDLSENAEYDASGNSSEPQYRQGGDLYYRRRARSQPARRQAGHRHSHCQSPAGT